MIILKVRASGAGVDGGGRGRWCGGSLGRNRREERERNVATFREPVVWLLVAGVNT